MTSLWRIDAMELEKLNKNVKPKEIVKRQESVRMIPLDFNEASRSEKAQAKLDETTAARKQMIKDAAKANKSNSKKRKEGLIVVKQFWLYALFLVCILQCFFYQASFEKPQYCLPGEYDADIDPHLNATDSSYCYQVCYNTLDETTSFADANAAFNEQNIYGYPEYVLEKHEMDGVESLEEYVVRGNFPAINRLLHLFIPVYGAILSLFYALWRFLRHIEAATLSRGTKVAGAIVGFLLFLTLSVVSLYSVAFLDPAVRSQWQHDLQILDSYLTAVSDSLLENGEWLETEPTEQIILESANTALVYSTGDMALLNQYAHNAASIFRTTMDFTEETEVILYCKTVCGADPLCVGFYLREYSMDNSMCAEVFYCDFYHSLDLGGSYVAAQNSDFDDTILDESVKLLLAQEAYAADPSNSVASTLLGDGDHTNTAEAFCNLLDEDLSLSPNITAPDVNITNHTLYRLVNRTVYDEIKSVPSKLLDLVSTTSSSIGTAARVWHERFVTNCKFAAEAANLSAKTAYGSMGSINSANIFMQYDCENGQIVPGINVSSPECLLTIPQYERIMFTSNSSTLNLIQISTMNLIFDSPFRLNGGGLQISGIIIFVLAAICTVLSATTVASRISTLVSRIERCTNCELVYNLKQQPLHCASCDDIFCKNCLVYSVRGQRCGLFSSEARSSNSYSDTKRDTLVCMDCFSQSFDKSLSILLHHAHGSNNLAFGYLNFMMRIFITQLEHKVELTNTANKKNSDRKVSDSSAETSETHAGSNGFIIKIELPRDKKKMVRTLKAKLRRAFGDLLDFQTEFMEQTQLVFDKLYEFASDLVNQAPGSRSTLKEFHHKACKYPRSSFSDVFLAGTTMDPDTILESDDTIAKICGLNHLGQFHALFKRIMDFTQASKNNLNLDAKQLLLTNKFMYEESLRKKFCHQADPFYRYDTASQLPNEAVLSFTKKYWNLTPQQQELFHEQLLWHSRTAQSSFNSHKAPAIAFDKVYVVMCQPWDSTQLPNIYHMYILEDFIAFFNAPIGIDDPCLVLDPASMQHDVEEHGSTQPHIEAETDALVEGFMDRMAEDARALQEGQVQKSTESKGDLSSVRRVSLLDLDFILTRSDIPHIIKKASRGIDFSRVNNSENDDESQQRAKLHYFARGKSQIEMKGIYTHVVEVVVAKTPNANMSANLQKVAQNATHRLFARILRWKNALPTSNSLGILRFESSYPPRDDGSCKMYLNGLHYFRDVVEAIGAARYNVMIADWCMSPRIYLRRESGPIQSFRLDLLLQRKARQGVQIFVLLYRDIAIGLGSENTEDYLRKLHPNVHIVRHNCLKSTISDKFDKIYYSHHQKCVVVDNSVAFVGGIDLCYGRFETPDYILKDVDSKWYPGHSYKNPQLELEGGDDKSHINEPFLTAMEIKRHMHHRMPWNDVHSCVTGRAAADVALLLTQRWQFHCHINEPTGNHVSVWPSLLLRDWKIAGTWKAGSVQLLRSMACWSGSEMVETSIYRCYLEMIRKAKRFIYIENQFFISAIEGNNAVHNRICQALFDRIMIAIRQKEEFRVIIVVPFHADGPLHSDMAMSVLHYLRCSVAFTPTSLLQCLARECGKIKDRYINLEDYIVFLSLAQWSKMAYEHNDHGFNIDTNKTMTFGKQAVYTQIYTHSKLMVVDDYCAIVGSANINDRSMLGDRDSEMAVYIEDRDFVSVRIGSEKVLVGQHMHKFRMKLMNKILSLDSDSKVTANLVSDEVYVKLLLATANCNTETFHRVFPEFPHSSYTSLNQYNQALTDHEEKLRSMPPTARNEQDERNIKLLKDNVKGLICQFPLKFLELDPTLINTHTLKAQLADAISGGAFFT